MTVYSKRRELANAGCKTIAEFFLTQSSSIPLQLLHVQAKAPTERSPAILPAVELCQVSKYTRYMYNDDPLRQRRPHTRTSQVTEVTYTQTLLHSKTGGAGWIVLRGNPQMGRAETGLNSKRIRLRPTRYDVEG